MKFLTLSDTHVRQARPEDRGWSLLLHARARAEEESPDIILFGGDLVEPGSGVLDDALRFLGEMFGVPVLWVIGNNDLEALDTRALSKYAEVAQERAQLASPRIHVLDMGPQVVNGVAFVGNYVGYDGSLYHDQASPRLSHLLSLSDQIFREAGIDTTPSQMFRACRAKLDADLSILPPEMPKVVFTHTVPDSRFLLYRHSPKFDDYNVGMGWADQELGATPGLRYQMCGHTHRAQEVVRPGLPPILNISGAGQPRVFTV